MVIRGSDDFYPRMDNSHGPHLYTNAYNAILLSNLGLQDWDMFQTALGQKASVSHIAILPEEYLAVGDNTLNICSCGLICFVRCAFAERSAGISGVVIDSAQVLTVCLSSWW